VIIKEIDGQMMEPFEQLVVDVEEQHQGGVMEKLGTRGRADRNMECPTARAACAWTT
jgi:GTP-binding protein